MRARAHVYVLSLIFFALLSVDVLAERIELRPVDAATIVGIPEGWDGEGAAEPRVFLRFDLVAIPPGVHIDYAELTVTDIALPEELPYLGLVASSVLREWNSDDISWDEPSEGTDWDNPGGDWDEVAFSYGAAGPGLMRPPFFNVTSMVRGWFTAEDEQPNYGLMLKPVDDQNTDVLVGIIDHTRLRPVLRVTYSEWE